MKLINKPFQLDLFRMYSYKWVKAESITTNVGFLETLHMEIVTFTHLKAFPRTFRVQHSLRELSNNLRRDSPAPPDISIWQIIKKATTTIPCTLAEKYNILSVAAGSHGYLVHAHLSLHASHLAASPPLLASSHCFRHFTSHRAPLKEHAHVSCW